MTIKLSIIIVSWNTKKLLRQCLESLQEGCGGGGGCEVIVVDNGSTDGSREMVRKYQIQNTKYKIHLIENQSNLGFAKGNNQGIKEAGGEYVMLLNTDTIVKEGAIKKLVEFLDSQPSEIGAVSPLVLNSDGTIQQDPCFLKFPSPLLVVFYYNSILKKIALRLFPKLLYSATDFSNSMQVDQLPGAAIMIKKKVLDIIGLFDEKFEIYFEDSDLCIRMNQAGFKLFLEPSAQIIHLGRQSIKPLVSKEGIEKFYFLNFKSLFRFCRKHKRGYGLIKLIIIFQVLITLRLRLLFRIIKY